MMYSDHEFVICNIFYIQPWGDYWIDEMRIKCLILLDPTDMTFNFTTQKKYLLSLPKRSTSVVLNGCCAVFWSGHRQKSEKWGAMETVNT
jgi:hypothetical protein